MSQDLRLYSLSLLIVLMLWTAPTHADYGVGFGCPTLAVPVSLSAVGDVWHAGILLDGGEDYRSLYPYDTTASMSGTWGDHDCTITADSGTYYDGANHLWTLDDDLTCDFDSDGGEFRAGDNY